MLTTHKKIKNMFQLTQLNIPTRTRQLKYLLLTNLFQIMNQNFSPYIKSDLLIVNLVRNKLYKLRNKNISYTYQTKINRCHKLKKILKIPTLSKKKIFPILNFTTRPTWINCKFRKTSKFPMALKFEHSQDKKKGQTKNLPTFTN